MAAQPPRPESQQQTPSAREIRGGVEHALAHGLDAPPRDVTIDRLRVRLPAGAAGAEIGTAIAEAVTQALRGGKRR